MTAAFRAGTMTWVLGIEDTCVYPPAHFDMASLDEYDLTDHTRRWREDLDTVKALGATALRYGVSWPRVHTAPGVFDWSVLDERLRHAAGTLGLDVIADLVHYGTPTWLDGSFADPRYPDAIAEFAGAFATRYRGLVDHITPLNEPVTTASFCGLRGVWPPALTGWAGWTKVTLSLVEGIRRTIVAVRAANPDAVVVHVEASALYRPATAALHDHSALLQAVAALPTDLLLGRVDLDHPMRPWLIEHGAAVELLDRFCSVVPDVDLLGVNYYPDLTPRTLVPGDGTVEQVATNLWVGGLRHCLEHFAHRYRLPMLITETSIEGPESRRLDWLVSSAQQVATLRAEGLDIRGYTWWPLFDFVDWSYASGGRNVEEFLLTPDRTGARAAEEVFADVADGRGAFLRRMGLLALDERQDGLALSPTTASATFHSIATSNATTQGIPDHVG